jgi:hypothetical protein
MKTIDQSQQKRIADEAVAAVREKIEQGVKEYCDKFQDGELTIDSMEEILVDLRDNSADIMGNLINKLGSHLPEQELLQKKNSN